MSYDTEADSVVTLPPHGRRQAPQQREHEVQDGSAFRGHTCRRCGAAATWGQLAMLGGMCGRCYDAWCCEKQPRKAKPPASVDAGNPFRLWARRLQYREQQGEQLSDFQAEAWRAALPQEEGGQA